MNDSGRLNGWSGEMMATLHERLREAAECEETKVVVLTGRDPYYCAGVQLSALLTKPMLPRTLHTLFEKKNRELFDAFITFPKPIIAAVNGPAIGASVTSASLCDAIVASEKATFHTPFTALGIPPEGCSSVHFERLMGADNAKVMLEEGRKVTAVEAEAMGLVYRVVAHSDLLPTAQRLGEEWVSSGRRRWLSLEDGCVARYRAVNAAESLRVANSFLSPPFLLSQYAFLRSRGKWQQAAIFWLLARSHPLWSLLL
jgi:peroxisomal 3,2-trans-enoyl-CoA isomerase